MPTKGYRGNHFLFAHLQYAIIVILSAGMPASGIENRTNVAREGEQYLQETT